MKLLKKIALILSSVFALWVGGFCLFAAHVLFMPTQTLDSETSEKTTDAIVVLTGGDQRIESGLELFAAGRATHLFITGVHDTVNIGDIKAMWKGETALPPCCITLGHKATSTTQNADETREWMIEHHYASIRLVTSTYHMPRSLLEFRHALPGIDIIPHPIAQPNFPPSHRYFWELLFIEYHKTIFRWLARG